MSKYIQNPDANVREETVEGGLLFNPDNNEAFMLNSTAIFIWQLCKEGKTMDEIVDALQAEFDGFGDANPRADAENFIKSLVDNKLLGTVE